MSLELFARAGQDLGGPGPPGPDSLLRHWHAAITAIAERRSVIVIHSDGASIVRAVAGITTRQMAELIRLTSGFVQVSLPEERCDELLLNEALPTRRNDPGLARGQCVSVDASVGIGTGISAADRASTARVLSDPSATASDLRRPGHVIPVRVRPGDASSPAAVALRLAQLSGSTAAVFAELVPRADPTRTVGAGEAAALAADLRTVTVAVSG